MRHLRHTLIPAVAAVALALASPLAVAQEQPAATDFSQQQLEAFVDAATAVQEVQSDLDAKAQAAQNPDEVAELQQQAQQDASQAVQESGLSVDEYAAIAEAANQNPDLYAQIVELMQERTTQ